MAVTRRIQHWQSGRSLRSGKVVLSSAPKTRIRTTRSGPVKGQLSLSDGSNYMKRKEPAKVVREPSAIALAKTTQGAADRRDFSKLMVVEDSAPVNPILAATPAPAPAPPSPQPLQAMDIQVGVPKDGYWKIDAALERRFCFEHAKHEWLLELEDTWLQPEEFKIVDALPKLERRKESDSSQSMKPGRRVRPADCNSSLWSQIHRVKDERQVGGARYFKIEWRPHWFQEDEEVDWEWAKQLLKERLQSRRRSGRNHDDQSGPTAGQRAILAVLSLNEQEATL